MEHFHHFMKTENELLQFRNFDEWMKASSVKIQKNPTSNTAAAIASVMFEFYKRHFFVMRVTSLKLMEIGRGIVSAQRDKNLTVHLSLARAFLEHTASLSYQQDLLRKSSDELPRTQGSQKIFELIEAFNKKVDVLYYGSSRGEKDQKFINVSDMIRVMKRDFNDIEAKYSYLCDFVHPNFGSNRLVSSGVIAQGVLLPDYSQFEPENEEANILIDRCSEYAEKCQKGISIFLIKLQNWIDIASFPDVKTTQIFTTRGANIGDGKSKKNAIYFFKARTHLEAMQALDALLKERGLLILSNREKSIEDNFLYEKLVTTGDDMWIKYQIER